MPAVVPLSYSASKVVINPTTVNALLSTGPGPNTLGVIADAPQGPDVPILTTPQQASTLYGLAGSSTSLGYRLPLAIQLAQQQQQSSRNTPFNLLVMRAGVTRASVIINDTQSGTPQVAFTLQGVGVYAGTKGNSLAVQITTSASVITSLTVVDTSQSNAIVFQITNQVANLSPSTVGGLSAYNNVVAAINGAQPVNDPTSVVFAVIGSGTADYATHAVAAIGAPGTSFTGGTTGKGAAYNDATITTLLNQSLAFPSDYLWAGWDANNIAATIISHLGTATSQNNYRMAHLGPALGTAYSTLTGSYASGVNNDRVQVVGHDQATMQDPVRGISSMFDGHYAALALGALKAVGPRRRTLNKANLAGITSVGSTGKTGALLSTDLDALGAATAVPIGADPQTGAPQIYDNITTAPYSSAGTNAINIFYQANMRDVDNAVTKALARAVAPFAGQARSLAGLDTTAIITAARTAITQLGDATNGFGPKNIQIGIDPATGNPQLAVDLLYPFRYGQIGVTPTVSF